MTDETISEGVEAVSPYEILGLEDGDQLEVSGQICSFISSALHGSSRSEDQ